MASNPVTHHDGLEVSTVVERKGDYRGQSQACVLMSYVMKDIRFTIGTLDSGDFLLKLTSDASPRAGSEFIVTFEREQLEQLRDTIDCIFQLEREDASLVHGTRERRMLDLSHLGITPTGELTTVNLAAGTTCSACSGAGRFDDIECPRCFGKGVC